MSEIERSSGNVFADLGWPDADLHKVKTAIVTQIAETMKKRRLTQQKAAALMQITQPDLSKMLRGAFRPTSLEKLVLCLTRLGGTVSLSVQAPKKNKTGVGRLLVA